MSTGDNNHAESCACLRPGDRECNCHLAYGFATAEEMQEFGEDDWAIPIRHEHDHNDLER